MKLVVSLSSLAMLHRVQMSLLFSSWLKALSSTVRSTIPLRLATPLSSGSNAVSGLYWRSMVIVMFALVSFAPVSLALVALLEVTLLAAVSLPVSVLMLSFPSARAITLNNIARATAAYTALLIAAHLLQDGTASSCRPGRW